MSSMTGAAGYAAGATARAAGTSARTAARTAARAGSAQARAVLTVVPRATAAPRAPRLPFAAAVVGLLVAGLIGLLVLNTVLGKDAFRLHELQVQGRQLADREQALTREVESLRSPGSLAAQAAALGMVPAGPPAFLRLPDGAVLGSAEPALAPEPPEPLPEPVAAAEDAPDEDAPDEDAPDEDAAAKDAPAADAATEESTAESTAEPGDG